MRFSLIVIVFFFLFISCEQQRPRVLVFSKTSGYRHKSIGPGKLAMMKLGRENGFDVDTTEDASAFNEENLRRYHAVIFLNTTQDVLDVYQQADFKRFIQAGGGFVGIHAAADTEYGWPWYGKLVGAYFKSHPKIQEADLKKVRPFGPDNLPEVWTRTDEWYNYKNINDSIHVIYNLDEMSYEGGENGANHPIAWYHEFDGGRAFYTGMGHTDESYTDSLYLQHVLQGIEYAIRNKKSLDYSKVTAKRVPEENRFTKTTLEFNLDEPTEMAMLPDGRIIFIERKGNVKLYSPNDQVKTINTFNVYSEEEDGMIGITIDPDFSSNHWVYVFYSHPERSANVVSRFVFSNNKLDMNSEKEIIEVPTQRKTCCHTGGSLAFGPDGNLYISTGDNTSPFESDGFSPSDERPERSPFDAQKSSANTNDLRGKILRIHPEPDGSYTIPEGNLFAKGEPATRPEIYVMGCRNPYRISIDEKTGYLYWGDVGPDARANDPLRGPQGYDEINQAKAPGFFGWPYFVGDNYAYSKYDFATNKAGSFFDPIHPLNTSPNNTGKKELPPAKPAFIWYPYGKSEHYPMVKEGGRNAMAGPFYYSEKYKGVATAFPDYFDGKLLVYDWMRNWMLMVTMNDKGAITDIEPFLENTEFSNIIDMTYGPDGRLYMLEYGLKWFSQNLDARLVRIDYNGGNRPPVAKLQADKEAGGTPLTVNFTAYETVDYDKDKLMYELEIRGKRYESTNGTFRVTLDSSGVYKPTLKVTDAKGAVSTAQVQIIAGNEPPVIDAKFTQANTMFFFPGSSVSYEITVSDKEDGSTREGTIPGNNVSVTFEYIEGFDVTTLAQGHQIRSFELPGKTLIDQSDCKSCHLIDQESAGPSYQAIATRYKSQVGAIDKLAEKIVRGGGGAWGDRAMAAHPQINTADAKKMVQYILALHEKNTRRNLPLSGSLKTDDKKDGVYVLAAKYMDKSVKNLPSLSASTSLLLKAPVLRSEHASKLHQATKRVTGSGVHFIDGIKNGSSLVFEKIDLTTVKEINGIVSKSEGNAEGDMELRLDSPQGELIGTIPFQSAKKIATFKGGEVLMSKTKIAPVAGTHDLYVIFRNKNTDKILFQFSQLSLSQ